MTEKILRRKIQTPYSSPKEITEEKNERLQQIIETVEKAGQDVQIFLGQDFEKKPGLTIREAEELEGKNVDVQNPPAGYNSLKHSVIFAENTPQVDKMYAEDGKIEEEGDFLYSLSVEEMTHAIQAEKLGLTGFKGKAKSIIGKYSSSFNDMPKFDAEGFASWTSDNLSNFSKWNYREQQLQEIHDTTNEELAEQADIDLSTNFGQFQLDTLRENMVKRPVEAYTGHAYYKALNQQEQLDAVVEEGLTPTRREDIDQILETIEESTVEPVLYDEVIKPYWQE